MSNHYVLKIQYVNKPPETRNIGARVTTIGREAGDIILGDPQSSGRHAEIYFENGSVRVKDLGSTNGTFYNGQRAPEFTLEAGQGFSIGQTVMTLMAIPGAAARAGAGKTMIAMGGMPRPPGAPPPGPGAPPAPPGGFGAPPPGAGFGAPPPPPGGFGAPPGPPPGGFGAPSGPPQGGFGAPPGPPPGGFGAPPGPPMGAPPPGGFGAPPGPPPGGGFGAPPPQGGFGGPPMGAPPMGAPPMGAPPMGAPPMGAPPMQQPGFGGPPPQQQPGFGAPPPGAPPPGGPPQGFGAPPPGPGPMMTAQPQSFGAPPSGSPMGMGQAGPPMGMGQAGGEIRGDFSGTGGELLGQLLVGYLLTLVTFGIYMPWFMCKFTNFIAQRVTFGPTAKGTIQFRFEGQGGQLFVTFLVGYLLTMVTFGIYMPWFICKLTKFFSDNTTITTSDGSIYNPRFEGAGGDLFVTFLVGYLLTMVTFGIYAPWFMCKLNKWFAERTKLVSNGQEAGSLDFTGEGGALLVTFIVGYLLTLVTFGIYMAWFQVKMIKFNADNTKISVNGQRFGLRFTGEGGELFVIILVGYLLSIVTLGIYMFWMMAKLIKWQLSNLVVFSEGGAALGAGMGGGGGYVQQGPPQGQMPYGQPAQPQLGGPYGQPQPGYGLPPGGGYGPPGGGYS